MAKYRLIDLQGAGTHEDEVFNSKKEAKEHLISYHSIDFTGEIPLKKFNLNDILDYGEWDIEEVK